MTTFGIIDMDRLFSDCGSTLLFAATCGARGLTLN